MDFKELHQEIKSKITACEWRFELPDFFEFVIAFADLSALNKILEGYFGPPVDLSQPLDDLVKTATDKWGGVRRNQHLYFRAGKPQNEIAFLWPWCDGSRVSVKIILDKPLDHSLSWIPTPKPR